MSGVATWIAVALLGGLGAVLRAVVDGWIRSVVALRGDGSNAGRDPSGADFPAGILVVNLTGSFAAGLLSGSALGDTAALLAATAFVGAYSTFSTWMLDVAQAAAGRLWLVAATNLLGGLVLGALAAAAGLVIGRLL